MPGFINHAGKNSNIITLNISYNNNNIIMTTVRHIENPGIVITVYLNIFRHIEGHSAIFSHVKAY